MFTPTKIEGFWRWCFFFFFFRRLNDIYKPPSKWFAGGRVQHDFSPAAGFQRNRGILNHHEEHQGARGLDLIRNGDFFFCVKDDVYMTWYERRGSLNFQRIGIGVAFGCGWNGSTFLFGHFGDTSIGKMSLCKHQSRNPRALRNITRTTSKQQQL